MRNEGNERSGKQARTPNVIKADAQSDARYILGLCGELLVENAGREGAKMDTRVGYMALSVLADIFEEEIRKCVDEKGRFVGDSRVIDTYIQLRKCLGNYQTGAQNER